ncbi:beta-mannosidase [Luteimonas notoginsengisoli]|uniref:Beta-mannosidase n=1 Tax=Luteimonas notoginsengisoli TaxID=1578200 RepID=A0ABV7UUR6_9GAMM
MTCLAGIAACKRRARWRACALAVACAALSAVAAACAGEPVLDERVLNEGWRFRLLPGAAAADAHPQAAQWRDASVPGTVHTDLLAQELIPDPYAGAAEAGLQWIGLADWEYAGSFDVGAATLAAARTDLVFDGLDTFAEVWLNGTKVLDADNVFRIWRVPVQGRLRARGNTLRVVLRSPIARLLPQVQAMPHRLAGNYPSPYGDEPRDAMTANFARKPGYHYGWDWGPRYVTAGIMKPVRLQSWDAVRIADLQIRQDRVGEKIAEIVAIVTVDAARDGDYALRLWQTDPDGRRTLAAQRRTTLHEGDSAVSLPVQIASPQRWFPTGYGRQPLYRFDVELMDGKAVVATSGRRTGLRSVELQRGAEGGGFAFVVNGVPVFAKGANAIPFDMFPPRVTDANIRRVLQSARDANMNMVRVWGGGYYERDAFYDIADELGLMVWQDFMFGGGMPPAYDPAFRASVAAEARDQVRRLRNHPSLVLWCGNNEEEIAWKSWGHGKALAEAAPAFADRVWQGYVQLFGHDLREIVAQEGGGTAYWSSSPGNDLAEAANTPEAGDMHYWEVWGNPAYPVAKYLEVTPRFMSEYGLQAWPVMRTVRAFAGDAPLSIDAPVVKAHQKFMAGTGNERLLHYIRMEYGEPRDFADFVYLGQVMQAEGIEVAALHHRASRPVTMGSLYWQLNDVWPGASWSGIDWYGRWKALHFHARRFFAPVTVAALRRDGTTTVSLLSDRMRALRGSLRLRVFDVGDGRLLRDERTPVELPPLAATVAMRRDDAELLAGADPRRSVAVFDLEVADEPPSRGTVWFAPARDIAWPDPGLRSSLVHDGDRFRLQLEAQRPVRALWIDFGDLDAELQDNALTLLPGERRSLRLSSPASLAALRGALHLRSLADALPSPDAGTSGAGTNR